ncbi:MAG: GEVED domain-containing protein [bacterium]
MSRRKNTCLFLILVSVFLLVFTFCPKIKAAGYLNICTESGLQFYPASAWNQNKSEYLAVWYSTQSPDQGIYGVRLDPNGVPKGSSSKIASTQGSIQCKPRVALNPDKNQYLVTWHDQDTDNTSAIYASLVSLSGGGGITSSPLSGIKKAKEKPTYPKAAWNGEQFLIVWYDYNGEATPDLPSADIYGVRIGSNGNILDPNALAICTAASSQKDPVVTGYSRTGDGGSTERGWLVAWVDERDSSSGKDIYAALIKQRTDGTASIEESFPVCRAEKAQEYPDVTTGQQGFFIVWQDGRYKDTQDSTGAQIGNFLCGARISSDGRVLLTPYGLTEIPITRLIPYEGMVQSTMPAVASIKNNYLAVWDYRGTVYGARISLEGDLLDLDLQSGVPKPLTLSDPGKYAQMASLSGNESGRNTLITWMGKESAQSQDIDIAGVVYTLPASPRLEWPSGKTEGVSPNQGEGGSEFTFQVNYVKGEGGGDEPIDGRLVVDLNHNGVNEGNEIFSPEKTGSTTYQKKIKILFDGDPDDPNSCILNYRFYFRDEYNTAEGEPTRDHPVKILPHGEVPVLSFLGEGNYLHGGVDPDSSKDETEFTFKVKYQDAGNEAPKKYQVWIDINGDAVFSDSEKFDMVKDGSESFSDGAVYRFKKKIQVNRIGLIAYRFYFDDGYNAAQGGPNVVYYLAITNISETCIYTGPKRQWYPDLASTSQGGLVVWEDLRDAEAVDQKVPELYQGSTIYGRFLDENGKKTGTEVQIGKNGQSQCKPKVAASRQDNIYLVVWEDLRNGEVNATADSPGYQNTDIYGQIVKTGDSSMQDIPIATYKSSISGSATSNQNHPAVAAGPDNTFFVVWEDGIALDVTGKNIHGTIVTYNSSSGATVSESPGSNENFIIYDENYGKDQINPAVAFGGQSYLVVWQDYRPETDGDVVSHLYGNPVDLNGHVMGSEEYSTISFPKLQNIASGLPIWIDPNYAQENPAIASDGSKFLVVWERKGPGATPFGKDIYGVLVGANGAMAGQPFPICRAKGNQFNPRIMWDTTSNSYLVVWTSQSFTRSIKGESTVGYDTDIRWARVSADGKLIGRNADNPGWEICTAQGVQDAAAIAGNANFRQVVWMDYRSYPYAVTYDFDIYGIPLTSSLNWVEDSGFFYGVNPGVGGNGKTYTFKINYLDLGGQNPADCQVWVDINGDGVYSEQEKYDMDPDSSDPNTADGKMYTKSISLTIPEGQVNGLIHYRFSFKDADSSLAAGSANLSNILQINPPQLFYTGETNYQSATVYPATGKVGRTFEFRVLYMYRPPDTTTTDVPPKTAQMWIDLNDDGQYQADEKKNLEEADSEDTNYADGKIYFFSFTGEQEGTHRYRFVFEHPVGGVAAGAPTMDNAIMVSSGSGGSDPVPPQLIFTGETNYKTAGVYPTKGKVDTFFEFRILYKYNPADTDGVQDPEPNVFQVWIDANQDGYYQSTEKKAMDEEDPLDTNCADGKIYSYSFKGEQEGTYRYRFVFEHPIGGDAVGAPTMDSTFTVSSEGGSSDPNTSDPNTPSDISTPVWTTYKTPKYKLASNNITSLAVQDNILWIGTSLGLSKFDNAQSKWSVIKSVKDPNVSITALAVDAKYKNLYVGTPQGLSKYNGSSWQKYDTDSTKGILSNDNILDMAFDEVHRLLWIIRQHASQGSQSQLPGSQAGSEVDPNATSSVDLIQYDLSKNTWTVFDKEYTSSHDGGGLPGEFFLAMGVDSNGDLWVSTYSFIGTGQDRIPAYTGVAQFKVEPKEWTYYTTASNNEGDESNKLKTDLIVKIWGSDPGFLWVLGFSTNPADTAGSEGGLYRFDLQDKKWIGHFSPADSAVKLGSMNVSALAGDGSNVWIGTRPKVEMDPITAKPVRITGGGASRYDGSSWKLFTTTDGLADNTIQAIAIQSLGEKGSDGNMKNDIWFATPQGLTRYGYGDGASGESEKSPFNPENRFAFPGSKDCFVSSLGKPLFDQHMLVSHRSTFPGWIIWAVGIGFLSLLGIEIAFPLNIKEISMSKKVVAFVAFILLFSAPTVARAESIRKGTSLELRGGFYRPSDNDKWSTAFGKGYSAFGGLRLNKEVMKNIELGISADYVHVTASEWSVYLIPVGLSMTYAMRYSQDQFFVPYLGGGIDYVYGRTGRLELAEDIQPTYLNEAGYHAVAGIRLLLDALAADDAFNFDQKYGVNNSYLVFEARYLKLFNADYADEELPEGEEGTGYLDPKGLLLSIGFMVEF